MLHKTVIIFSDERMRLCQRLSLASLLFLLFILLALKYPPCCDVYMLHRGKTEASWTRNLTALVRPQAETTLAEPSPSLCTGKEINLVVAVVSAPSNSWARYVIR